LDEFGMLDVLSATHQGSGNFLLRNGFTKLLTQQCRKCGSPTTQIPFLDYDAVMADFHDRMHRLVRPGAIRTIHKQRYEDQGTCNGRLTGLRQAIPSEVS
jgi:hypothetical protein